VGGDLQVFLREPSYSDMIGMINFRWAKSLSCMKFWFV
jgi:hypothetical protein